MLLRRTLLTALGLAPWIERSLFAQKPEEGKELAPYFPSPKIVVRKMLDVVELKSGERMFDLGSGDGRIVIMAAKEFKARATGVELASNLVVRSRGAIQKAGLEKIADIIEGDFTKQDYTAADVVTLYLLPEANAILAPILTKQLKPGTRVVAHDFPVPGWKEVKTINIPDDGEGRSHTLYLYHR